MSLKGKEGFEMERLTILQQAKTELWNREYTLQDLTWESPITFYSNGFMKRILSPYEDSIWMDVYTKGMFFSKSFQYRERIRVYQLTPGEAEDLKQGETKRDCYIIQYCHFQTGEQLIYLIVPAMHGLKSRFEKRYQEVTHQLYTNEELMLGLQLWIFGWMQDYYRQKALYFIAVEEIQLEGERDIFSQRLTEGHTPVTIEIKNLKTKECVKQIVPVDIRLVEVEGVKFYRWLQYAATPIMLFTL